MKIPAHEIPGSLEAADTFRQSAKIAILEALNDACIRCYLKTNSHEGLEAAHASITVKVVPPRVTAEELRKLLNAGSKWPTRPRATSGVTPVRRPA